jgi:transposase
MANIPFDRIHAMSKPPAKLTLSDSDRTELQAWLRKTTLDQRLAQRARILLELDAAVPPAKVSERLGLSAPVVFKWRNRYEEQGLKGLGDLPRPGQPRKLSEQKVHEILTLTTQRVPVEATHWSLRLMAKHTGATVYQVRQVWQGADLKPHRLQNFKISNDPHFAEKVVDVVGLYMNPPENAVVLSVDEKTQIQALDRTQPMLPLRPGQIERRTHDYKRHGTASLYAAFDILTGNVMGRITARHRAREFLDFMRQIDKATAPTLDLHVILDNSSTHKTAEVKAWLAKHPRVKLHFTPTSASWLNAVERWFASLERRALYRGVFGSVQELREAIRQFIDAHNAHSAKPFRWTKSAEAILAKVERARTATA